MYFSPLEVVFSYRDSELQVDKYDLHMWILVKT